MRHRKNKIHAFHEYRFATKIIYAEFANEAQFPTLYVDRQITETKD